MKPIELTADEIKELDDINREAYAISHTFKVAIGHHSNRIEQNQKSKHDWWEKMAGRYNFPLDVAYESKRVGVKVVIREKLESEQQQEEEKEQEFTSNLITRMLGALRTATKKK